VDVYLDYCKKKGRAPEKPFSGTFNIRLTPEVHQRIAMRAAHDGVSLNKWVAKALETVVSERHA
jgi:predicted HicB family RNase H-like nuclease